MFKGESTGAFVLAAPPFADALSVADMTKRGLCVVVAGPKLVGRRPERAKSADQDQAVEVGRAAATGQFITAKPDVVGNKWRCEA